MIYVTYGLYVVWVLRGACIVTIPLTDTNLARELSLLRPWSWTYGAHLLKRVIADISRSRPSWFPPYPCLTMIGFSMSDEKNQVRQSAKSFRDQLLVDPDWADQAAHIFFDSISIPIGAVVSAYFPIGKEIDTLPIVKELWTRNIDVCLPVMLPDNLELKFSKWESETGLLPASFGILEPAEKEWVEPDVLIVPLLAFDQRGCRMGYGKGHYDATIAALRAKKNLITVGLAYAEQAVLLALPTEPHDQKLDFVITPQRFFDFRS